MISKHPKSKLAALGVEVIFECKIMDGAEPHWVVNNQAILLPSQVLRASREGFFTTSNTKHMVTTLTLQMNATADKNGTEAYCTSLQPPRSNTAILLIIAGNTHYYMIPLTKLIMPNFPGSPVYPNPSLSNINATFILLKWSPPFLWPSGSSIAYYNISVTNVNGESDFYRVNTTFSDAVVSFSLVSNQSQSIEFCDPLTFVITPITDSEDNDTPLKSFVAIGGFIPSEVIT
jgi:hypothetical protein